MHMQLFTSTYICIHFNLLNVIKLSISLKIAQVLQSHLNTWSRSLDAGGTSVFTTGIRRLITQPTSLGLYVKCPIFSVHL